MLWWRRDGLDMSPLQRRSRRRVLGLLLGVLEELGAEVPRDGAVRGLM